MANLVQVPWQPSLWLTPDTLDLLVRAGNMVGQRLLIYMAPDGPTDGAWRSWERQNYLYQKALAGGNVASNPNNGQRMHMRGGAFDLVRTDATVQAACRAVGLIRDGVEKWHWNNPRMTSMPIIPVNTNTAGSGTTPIEPEEEIPMLINWNGQQVSLDSILSDIATNAREANTKAAAALSYAQVAARVKYPDGGVAPSELALGEIVGNTRAILAKPGEAFTDAQVQALAAAVVASLPTNATAPTVEQIVAGVKSIVYKAA